VSWQLASVLPIWVIALVASLLVGFFAPPADYLTWLPVSLAGSAVLAFGVQLGIQRKDGFVTRLMASITGAVVVLGAATAILSLVA
jgi:hypothetical protein